MRLTSETKFRSQREILCDPSLVFFLSESNFVRFAKEASVSPGREINLTSLSRTHPPLIEQDDASILLMKK